MKTRTICTTFRRRRDSSCLLRRMLIPSPARPGRGHSETVRAARSAQIGTLRSKQGRRVEAGRRVEEAKCGRGWMMLLLLLLLADGGGGMMYNGEEKGRGCIQKKGDRFYTCKTAFPVDVLLDPGTDRERTDGAISPGPSLHPAWAVPDRRKDGSCCTEGRHRSVVKKRENRERETRETNMIESTRRTEMAASVP